MLDPPHGASCEAPVQADATSFDSNDRHVSKPVPLQEGEKIKLSVEPEDCREVPADGPLKGSQECAPTVEQVPVPVFVPRLKQEGMAGWGRTGLSSMQHPAT